MRQMFLFVIVTEEWQLRVVEMEVRLRMGIRIIHAKEWRDGSPNLRHLSSVLHQIFSHLNSVFGDMKGTDVFMRSRFSFPLLRFVTFNQMCNH